MKENTVTQEQVNEIYNEAKIECIRPTEKTLIVVCTLKNGFVIVESSSCVDPKNFSYTIGEEICRERIKNKIWELEGYSLQKRLSEASNEK